MNPEDNNPLSNPFATGGMTGSPDPMTGTSGVPMPDNLASAQDSLTAAGMAANQGASGAMGLDQIAAADTNAATLPLVEEPLVPAAPVPGSIGSAVSMPPADPIAAPDFSGFGEPTSTSAPATGAMPAPEVAPSPAPFNPFATPSTSTAQSAPAPQPTANPAPTASAPQPAPAPVPMGATQPKAKPALSPLTVIFGVVAVLLLVLAITFFILWNNEKKNVKPVYYPQVSEESSDAAIKSISCQRSESQEDPAGSGRSVITIGYTGDELSAYASALELDFSSEDDANRMREVNAAAVENLTSLVSTLSVSDSVSSNVYSRNITSEDDIAVAAEDVMNVIYGTAEGEPSLALADVQAKYESEGFVCTEE